MAEERYRRVFLIVVDSLGVGGAKDAADYGGLGSDTLGHISDCVEQFSIPNLQRLGMANLHPLRQVMPAQSRLAIYGMDE